MSGIKYRSMAMKTICFYALLMTIIWGLLSCGNLNLSDRFDQKINFVGQGTSIIYGSDKLSESPPPQTIEKLNLNFDRLSPQVAILAPEPEQVFSETTVEVKLQVQDLSLFKDDLLEMGPHLNLIVDNQPYRPIYNLQEPIILENLAPGTHTLRVFAVRPWNESFKTENAYAQTTFHILTKTQENNPDPNLPLLTYNVPSGKYGAEPIMLDFYLTNAPPHRVAQLNSEDEIKDWQIRVTVNGENFLLDQWETIYLKGFKQGNNWIRLELIDEDGNSIDNAFNNTLRLVTYEPTEKDTLAKLIEGQISAIEARRIVEEGYSIEPPAAQQIEEPMVIEPELEEQEPLKTSKSETVPESQEIPITPNNES